MQCDSAKTNLHGDVEKTNTGYRASTLKQKSQKIYAVHQVKHWLLQYRICSSTITL